MPRGFTYRDWEVISEWFQAALLTTGELKKKDCEELKLRWIHTAEKVQAEKHRLLSIRESKEDKD